MEETRDALKKKAAVAYSWLATGFILLTAGGIMLFLGSTYSQWSNTVALLALVILLIGTYFWHRYEKAAFRFARHSSN